MLLGMALPAVVYLPSALSPLSEVDDHEMFVLTGQTSESVPHDLVGYVDLDMRTNGRFRPLYGLERLPCKFTSARLHHLRGGKGGNNPCPIDFR